MPTYAKIERGIVDKQEFDRHVKEHIQYVKQLIEKGHKARSGYWGDFGGGMLLFEAENLQQAEIIVSNDPLIKNNNY